MHGFRPQSEHELSTARRWASERNFGLIALSVWSALAVAAAVLMFEFAP